MTHEEFNSLYSQAIARKQELAQASCVDNPLFDMMHECAGFLSEIFPGISRYSNFVDLTSMYVDLVQAATYGGLCVIAAKYSMMFDNGLGIETTHSVRVVNAHWSNVSVQHAAVALMSTDEDVNYRIYNLEAYVIRFDLNVLEIILRNRGEYAASFKFLEDGIPNNMAWREHYRSETKRSHVLYDLVRDVHPENIRRIK